jgi:hypothetical protein
MVDASLARAILICSAAKAVSERSKPNLAKEAAAKDAPVSLKNPLRDSSTGKNHSFLSFLINNNPHLRPEVLAATPLFDEWKSVAIAIQKQ